MLFSERYRPHDELVVYMRHKRDVNVFFRMMMIAITIGVAALCLATPGGSCMSGMGLILVVFGWIAAMGAMAVAWCIALFYVSHKKIKPLGFCACGYDLRMTVAAGINRCPECGRNTPTKVSVN